MNIFLDIILPILSIIGLCFLIPLLIYSMSKLIWGALTWDNEDKY